MELVAYFSSGVWKNFQWFYFDGNLSRFILASITIRNELLIDNLNYVVDFIHDPLQLGKPLKTFVALINTPYKIGSWWWSSGQRSRLLL